MTTGTSGPGRDGLDLDGCTKSHCHRAKRDGTGLACHQAAGWGTDHPGFGSCKLHGGSTQSHRAAAQVEQAQHAVATYGLPREVAPDVALLEEVHRSAGHVAWLAEVVANLEPEDLVWGKTDETDKHATEFPGTDTTRKATPNVWLVLYGQERKHLAAVCKDALAAGVAERQVQLAEQQGQLMAEVVRRIADALLAAVLGVLGEVEQPEVVRAAVDAVRRGWPSWLGEIVPREFRAISAGGGQ